MKFNPIVAICCLALGTVVSLFIVSALQEKPDSIAIFVRDGSGLSGANVLNAAYLLSSERTLEIRFQSSHRHPDSITAMSDSLGDLMSLELRANEIRMGGEVLLENELVSRLRTYSETARLTDSMPVILVEANDMTSGERLVTLFQVLRDAGISHIVPRYTTNAANQGRQATASPSPAA